MSTSTNLPIRYGYTIMGISDLMSFSDEEIDYDIYKYNMYLSRGMDYRNITILAFARKFPPEEAEVSRKTWLKGPKFEYLMKHVTDVFKDSPHLCLQILGPQGQAPILHPGSQSLDICTFPDIQIVPGSSRGGLWNKVASVAGVLFIRNVVRFPMDFIRACANIRGLHMDGIIDLIPSSHPWNVPPMVEDLVIAGTSALRCILEPFKRRPSAIPFINVIKLQILVISSKLCWRDPDMEGGLLNLIYQARESLKNVYIFNTMAGPVDTIISLDKSLPPLSIVLSFYIHDTVNDRWPTICKLIGILRGSTMRTLVLEMSAPFESRDENTLDVSSLAADWDAFFDSFKTYPTDMAVHPPKK